jgi:hypothetical protein
MNQEIRNKLRNVVTQCRKLLEDSVSQELEGKYGIFARREVVTADPNAAMSHLSEEEQTARKDILDHFGHIKARGFKPKDALDQLVREIAFTHLNRLCAYKMMEAREVYVGGQKFREAVSRGINSNGVKFYLADHPEEERLFNTGHQDVAYRRFLDWLGGLLSDEIGVLFNPNDPANRLYPRQKVLDDVLDLLNGGGIRPDEVELREEWPKIWSQDETIGWVYQYFTPKELRDQARKESAAPRNSYELAFRNQFFTPRYVVEFLTDNTLGRIWYEMREGNTTLKDQCRYMVRRPTELFLKDGEDPPKDAAEGRGDLSQEELLKQPVHIPHRAKKDPRDLKALDPACGSGHFLLYCFDLFLTIYEEAYADTDLGPALNQDYETLEDLRRDVPRLILAHNLHGIDIDLRASQIAALALWLRCQRTYQEMGLKKDRPTITRSNFVCAEPMPGEEQMRKEFVAQLEPKFLGQVVEVVFDKMKLAGEAGSLLKIEMEIRETVAEARKQWTVGPVAIQRSLFGNEKLAVQQQQFDFSGITDTQFFEQAEAKVIEALSLYAEKAQNGQKLQRRLFAGDAVRGFAFVDLCHKRYDVVLMNPPFGLAIRSIFEKLKRETPSTYTELFASFVSRGLSLTAKHGVVGAITSRAYLTIKRLQQWRQDEILPTIDLLLDLGPQVMDSALVESCAYVLAQPSVYGAVHAIDARPARRGNNDIDGIGLIDEKVSRHYIVNRSTLQSLPGGKLLYAVPPSIHELLRCQDVFEPQIGTIRQGMGTFDDFRFVRLRWEVPIDRVGQGKVWEPLAKGGAYARFYSDIHLMLNWADDGRELGEVNMQHNGQVSQVRQASDYWRRPGCTYSKRSQKGFSLRTLPSNCIITGKGPAILSLSGVPNEYLLGWFNSRLITFLIELQANYAEFNTGILKKLPWYTPRECDVPKFGSLAASCAVAIRNSEMTLSETNSCFVGVPVKPSIQAMVAYISDALTTTHALIESASREWNEHVDVVYGVCSEGLDSSGQGNDEPQDEEEEVDDEDSSPVVTSLLAVQVLLSYCVGCSFGRWDIRYATGEKPAPNLTDPFAPVPVCPPGALQDINGLATSVLPEGYPLRIGGDGILVDDADHPDDIVRHIRRVLEVVWKGHADTIEEESFEILGVKELRDYFRKLGKSGFWDDHISRYSKSRRKAPIYWLLQSSKKNYALWLYYHRLDKDLVFKALVNFVEPKIRLETGHLESLRNQMAAEDASGKEAKRLAKEVELQEDFLSELRDFEDKLRRAANLNLEPDLNDGVVLNIAPLYELVPWREAKNYWEELLDGKYEWSSIGKQLRQKGLVK